MRKLRTPDWPPVVPVDHLLRIGDVARALRVSPALVIKEIDRGALPVARIGERTVRIRVSALEAYVKAREWRGGVRWGDDLEFDPLEGWEPDEAPPARPLDDGSESA